jgi:tRNA modification GTPase
MQVDKPYDPDTIVAIATATGAGGIGVIRISGSACNAVAISILGFCPISRSAVYTAFKEQDNTVIDRGIAIYYEGPNSYTGEDVLELQAHGGNAVMQLLLARCVAAGARHAAPGEFTRRAYLNEKLDLAQAEAVADLINASTAEAARSAVRSLSGEFSQHIQILLKKLIELRLYVEACLDFPEDEIDFITQGRVAEKLIYISNALNLIFKQAKQGSLLRDGINVVLIGQPNVGKSSLMNILAGEDIAIVTSIAGTTRDTIKASIQINGVPIHVIDTAGLRETDDEVEKFGIARTWRAAETAHIALLLIDPAHGIADAEKSILERLPQEIHKIWVHNKIDVSRETPKLLENDGESHVFLSAKTGEGVDILQNQLLKFAGYEVSAEGVFMARARHLNALEKVAGHLHEAEVQIGSAELVAEELRLAQDDLASITGEFTPDDLLGEIFSKFCIGK